MPKEKESGRESNLKMPFIEGLQRFKYILSLVFLMSLQCGFCHPSFYLVKKKNFKVVPLNSLLL